MNKPDKIGAAEKAHILNNSLWSYPIPINKSIGRRFLLPFLLSLYQAHDFNSRRELARGPVMGLSQALISTGRKKQMGLELPNEFIDKWSNPTLKFNFDFLHSTWPTGKYGIRRSTHVLLVGSHRSDNVIY